VRPSKREHLSEGCGVEIVLCRRTGRPVNDKKQNNKAPAALPAFLKTSLETGCES
jgi:hypothetical protein